MELIDRMVRPKIDKRIFLSSPHMGKYEKKFIDEAFLTNWISPLGPNVENFEIELSDYVGSGGGIALSSGTAAVHMAVKLLGVSKGDIVFCSSLTFVASCNPIIYEGAEPVFIDSEPESLNMSPIALENAFRYYKKLGKLPKAVIVVHLYGQSADMDPIMEICNKYKVSVIEDAAESLGATYKGVQTGTIGKYGVYSFNGNKIITTSGGGMLVSNNIDGLHKAKFWATQSRDNERYYQHSELGYNYRMSNVVAGIGRGQLKVIEERIKKKKEIYEFYKNSFIEIDDIEMAPVRNYGEPNYWLSVITLSKDSKVKPIDIILALEKENIESRPVWKPMHLQPYFEEYRFFKHNEDDEISVSEDVFNRGVCLPSDTKMTVEEQEYVIEIIKELFREI
ncbi:DegT/DnrJ/EryC1/StrS family aminotransferase [Clostridium sp. NSJ-49]|uniref:DegT/DnrJ/EryC1/StrS family aminotransferase n=1 Tax=Clostridium TaxID=1485 RepID=UPI002433A09F|nr:DegT/DnrJ/EryC1/StrS family aminotransferase [Clostridium sp. NSJ-49]